MKRDEFQQKLTIKSGLSLQTYVQDQKTTKKKREKVQLNLAINFDPPLHTNTIKRQPKKK